MSSIHRLLRNGAVMALGGLVAMAIFLAIEALLAREVGVRAYGVFGSIYALTLLMVHVVDMGMNSKLIEIGSRWPQSVPLALGRMLSTKVALFLFVYPVVLLGLVLADWPNALAFFSVFAFFGLSMTIQDSCAAVYGSQQRMEYNALFQTAVPVCVLLAVFAFVGDGATLLNVALAYVAGSCLVTAVWLVVVWVEMRPPLVPPEPLRVVGETWHYGVSALLSYGSFRMGTLTLAAIHDPIDVGVFVAAYKFVELAYKVPQLANRVLAPQLFADSAHRPEVFRRGTQLLMRVALLGSLAAALLVVFAADLLIDRVFGAEFAAAGPVLRVLGIALGFKAFALAIQSILSAANLHTVRTRALGVSTAMGLTATIVLTLGFGSLGAAFGVLLGDVVLVVMLLTGRKQAVLAFEAQAVRSGG